MNLIPLPNPDHTLFRKGSGQCCGQAKENNQDSRYVEAHVKHFDTAFRGFFPFVSGSARCSARLSLARLSRRSRAVANHE
jgi:hypothetical protein